MKAFAERNKVRYVPLCISLLNMRLILFLNHVEIV